MLVGIPALLLVTACGKNDMSFESVLYGEDCEGENTG